MTHIPIILDGKFLAQQMEKELNIRIGKIMVNTSITPVLATILVGDDPSSLVYVNMKRNACKRVGINSEMIHLPQETSTEQLSGVIHDLNRRDNVYGILLQHPVPKHINERLCFDNILLAKDVDGVTSEVFGKMSMKERVYGSATPGGIMKLLKYYNITVAGKEAVIVGRSPILGKPMAMMLLNEDATVTICHLKTRDLQTVVKRADILVGCVGIPNFIKSNWIKDNAVVIDAGYHKGGFGDVELGNAKERVFAYTPVPGGVGPMTIAALLYNTVESAEKDLASR